MSAIALDFDAELLNANDPGLSSRHADESVERYPTVRGFTWMNRSTYFGDESVDPLRCARVVQKLAKTDTGFTPSVRDSRLPRIEEINDLRIALDDDDD